MIGNQLLLIVYAFIFHGIPVDVVSYRSPALEKVNLTPGSGGFFILDDEGSRIEITEMTDEAGLLYWYRRIKTAVCQTGECKLVDVGLYWDCTGDFFGLEVYGEHLTKTDHSVFAQADYAKLLDILHNDWSLLREYDFEELTSEPAEMIGVENGRADAASGATRKEIASEAVENAVYTTYTLWHLIHNGEKEQLIDLTVEKLNTGDLTGSILNIGTGKYTLFLLDLLAQSRIEGGDRLIALIMQGLGETNNPHLQDLALKSLGNLEIDSDNIQRKIAHVYVSSPADIRLRIVSALRKITRISNELYAALKGDVHLGNEWFAVKVLELLKHAPVHTPDVIDGARRLSKSNNTYARQAAERFLKSVNSSNKLRN